MTQIPGITARRAWWQADSTPARLLFRPRWTGEGGVRQLLVVALPLVLSVIAGTINLFFDRYFLSKFDIQHHMSAALTGGMSWWALQHLPLGIVLYANTFVAQYEGAKRPNRIGPAMWAAIYVSVLGAILNFLIYPMWGPLFRSMHPEGPLAELEAAYCQTLTWGALFLLVSNAFAAFYSGRGKTVVVMIISFIMAGSNILLNMWLIFNPPSWLPFIEPGCVGAAWATNFSFVIAVLIYMVLIFRPYNERLFQTLSGWRPDMGMLRRLIRYGAPHGANMVIEVGAFAFFILMIARVDELALVASNIAFTVNMVMFLPMMMVAQALSILVGQFVGQGKIIHAERSASSALTVNLMLMTAAASVYILVPDFIVGVFTHEDGQIEAMETIAGLTRLYLVMIALYTIGDAIGITMAGAVKGAGDTTFIMWVSGIFSLGLLVIPCTILALVEAPAVWMWVSALAYITVTGAIYLVRYRSGHWRSMKVIEPELSVEVPKLSSEES